MSLEDIMPSEKRANIVGFHSHEVPRVVQLIEPQSRMVVARGSGKVVLGIYGLTGTEFQFERWKSSGDEW